MSRHVREWPKSQVAWGYYNFGRLIGIAHRRKDAIKAVEELTGLPWKDLRECMEVHRVRVEKYAP